MRPSAAITNAVVPVVPWSIDKTCFIELSTRRIGMTVASSESSASFMSGSRSSAFTEDYLPGALRGTVAGYGRDLDASREQPAAINCASDSPRQVVFSCSFLIHHEQSSSAPENIHRE